MGRFVVVAYRPRSGRAHDLRELVREHHAVLSSQGLVTSRLPYLMRGADGTLIEVFEWSSAEAIEAAHSNPVVLAMWERFADVCDYAPLESLGEANQIFAEFETVD